MSSKELEHKRDFYSRLRGELSDNRGAAGKFTQTHIAMAATSIYTEILTLCISLVILHTGFPEINAVFPSC